MFLSSGDEYVGELLELLQGCQRPFRGSRGKVGFLSRHCSEKRLHLAWSGESPVFTRVAAANLGFLSSYDRDLGDSLVGPQERPVSIQLAKGLSGFLCCHCRGRGPHLDLRLEPQVSSPVPTWILEFLWSFHRGVRPSLLWKHASPLSSLTGKAVSGFLSC